MTRTARGYTLTGAIDNLNKTVDGRTGVKAGMARRRRMLRRWT